MASMGRRGIDDSWERTEHGSLADSSVDSEEVREARDDEADSEWEWPVWAPVCEFGAVLRVLRRLRPPRRPRRLRPPSDGCFAAGDEVAEASTADSESESESESASESESDSDADDLFDFAPADGEANSSELEALSSDDGASSGIGGGASCGKSSCESGTKSPPPPPKRVAASCAFVFQSARRKRDAAVEYHLAASAFWLAVSNTRANSNAPI